MGYTIASSVRASGRPAPEPRPSPVARPWTAAIVGGAVAAAATLPGLGAGTLWDNSETAYGEVAREILLTHDWIVMHFNGVAWFVQPPLYFWIAAAFVKAFGLTPFALRLPSAIATIAIGAAVGYASATLAGSRVGIYGAMIVSTSLMQAIIGRLAIMDALLDLAVTIGILAIFRAFTGGRAAVATIGAAVALAFGVLAKGPVAIAVVLLVIVPWLIWERSAGARLFLPRPRLWLTGCAIFAAIVAPWFVLLAARAGMPALASLIGHYTFGRYLGTIENQSGPLWYYVPVVILGFFPWIAYLPGALAAAWSEARSPSGSLSVHVARLGLVWAIAPFVFFSFAQTKLPNYIALELPALAVLVALWFDRIASGGRRRGVLVATAAVPLTIGAVAFAIALYAHDAHLLAPEAAVIGDLVWAGGIIFSGSIVTFVLLALRFTRIAPYALAMTALLTVSYIAIVAEPHAEPFKPIPSLAAVIRANERPGDAIALAGVGGGNALLFYTRPPIEAIGDANGLRSAICSRSRVFLVTSAKEKTPSEDRNRRTLASRAGDVLYLYDGPSCR